MRVVIAGSRGFNDREYLFKVMDALPWRGRITEVISGAARGADTLGEAWATSRGIPLHCMPADWRTFGKLAGKRRNVEMAERADVLVAFWDGSSPGTRHMILTAHAHGLSVLAPLQHRLTPPAQSLLFSLTEGTK